MAQAYQLPLVTDVVVQSNFWSPTQDRARHKTIPALIARQKEAEYWYCLTWKEGHKVMEVSNRPLAMVFVPMRPLLIYEDSLIGKVTYTKQ
jgi:hypothetical protein